MTQLYPERIAVVGPGVVTAEVEFGDGCPVAAGASDTGKSNLCSLVDFVYGASGPTHVIEQGTNGGSPLSGLVHRESASHMGKNWVEASIPKEGVPWAHSGRYFVNIFSRNRLSFWGWGCAA